jgi:hypothetical protein
MIDDIYKQWLWYIIRLMESNEYDRKYKQMNLLGKGAYGK